jgi:hypothetical protein
VGQGHRRIGEAGVDVARHSIRPSQVRQTPHERRREIVRVPSAETLCEQASASGRPAASAGHEAERSSPPTSQRVPGMRSVVNRLCSGAPADRRRRPQVIRSGGPGVVLDHQLVPEVEATATQSAGPGRSLPRSHVDQARRAARWRWRRVHGSTGISGSDVICLGGVLEAVPGERDDHALSTKRHVAAQEASPVAEAGSQKTPLRASWNQASTISPSSTGHTPRSPRRCPVGGAQSGSPTRACSACPRLRSE